MAFSSHSLATTSNTDSEHYRKARYLAFAVRREYTLVSL